MRQFQKVLQELKEVVLQHQPGDILSPPSLMPSVEIGGRRLSYVCAGMDNPADKNPPVVLLHGFGGFFMDWPRIMMPVARHTRVYALDLPGWGFSEPNRDVRSLEDDVSIVEEFLKRLNLDKVVLVGLSYGGAIAWAAGAMNSERIQKTILLNPMPPHPIRHMRSPLYKAIFLLNASVRSAVWSHKIMNKAQYKLICKENLLNDRLLDSFYLDLAYMVIKQPKIPIMLHTFARGARDLDWNLWEKRLKETSIPVSILQGKNDRIFSTLSARYLHRLIPTSELIEIAECGHAMVFDQHRKASDFIIRSLGESHQETLLKDSGS